MRGNSNSLIGISMVLSAVAARAQTLTYPGCANPVASEFPVAELAGGKGLQEPVGFDLQAVWNAAGDSVIQTNIFFVERLGKVKYYDGATGTVSLAATIPVLANSSLKMNNSDDNGLMGIALDPKFSSNRWLYLWYGPVPPNAQTNPRLRLSRFTVTPQNTLDMASEKILIDILTSKGEHRHAGGPMAFDAHGDLWVTLGQSGNDINYPTQNSQWSLTDSGLNQEWGPSNTASLRGGIFRIHPDESAASKREDRTGRYGPGYTVPAGNFGEYWSAQFQGQGKADLATQYKDPAKVLPEVYVKGNRSPHSIGVHPTKRWMSWGEVNPPNNADEINLITHPVFAGMPYFYGNNTVVNYPGNVKNPAEPTNTSPMNSGVTILPPAMPGTMTGGVNVGNVAIAGPFYVYNRSLRNRDKLPPHFDNHSFHLSFQANTMFVNTLDTVTGAFQKTDRIENGLFKEISLRSPLAARVGADGALYVLNYDGYYSTNRPAVARIRYTGSCFLPPPPVAIPNLRREPGFRRSPEGITVPGRHSLRIRDTAGRILLRLGGDGPAEYRFRDIRARIRHSGGLVLFEGAAENGPFAGKFIY